MYWISVNFHIGSLLIKVLVYCVTDNLKVVDVVAPTLSKERLTIHLQWPVVLLYTSRLVTTIILRRDYSMFSIYTTTLPQERIIVIVYSFCYPAQVKSLCFDKLLCSQFLSSLEQFLKLELQILFFLRFYY